MATPPSYATVSSTLEALRAQASFSQVLAEEKAKRAAEQYSSKETLCDILLLTPQLQQVQQIRDARDNCLTRDALLAQLRTIPELQANKDVRNLLEAYSTILQSPEQLEALFKIYFQEKPKKESVDIAEFNAVLKGSATFGSYFTEILQPVCWSSARMTELMTWRNPNDQAKPTALRSIMNITKRVVAEVALPILTITAAVETVARKLLSSKSYESAKFTTVWAASTLLHNITQTKLPEKEAEAREILFKGYFKA